MAKDFTQIEWNNELADDCRQLVRLAVREDLDRGYDWTTVALINAEMRGAARVVTREPGVAVGLLAAGVLLGEMQADVTWNTVVSDGDAVSAGVCLATANGSARDLLTCERPLLNFIGRLSGIATLTRRYVDQVAGTKARIHDTRKTTPGWRRLEKYAVRCGGGRNHRTGLFDAVLIKDNHLAVGKATGVDPATAVRRVRELLENCSTPEVPHGAVIEIEVDSLEQLRAVLPIQPDIVLLDNMSHAQLHAAVTLRDELAPLVELEASGGVNLQSVRGIAESGVDRISVGALTHSARTLDIALDWQLQQ